MSKPNLVEMLPSRVSFEMIYVEGGNFLMGNQEKDAFDHEIPVHKVTLPGFYIGKYPVTQAIWKVVMGKENNPSEFRGDDLPIETISWNDTQEFLEKLNELIGKEYRLLSESEWEYAARGGQKSQGYKYAGSNKLKEVGWYGDNSYGATKPVGLKYPNELGIYDMSGNVFEWVEDQWHDDYKGGPEDGSAWMKKKRGFLGLGKEREDTDAYRVIRGGSWLSDARHCRVAFRNIYGPAHRDSVVGFRLGLSL